MKHDDLRVTDVQVAALKLLMQEPYFTDDNRPPMAICDRLSRQRMTTTARNDGRPGRKIGCNARLSPRGRQALEAAGVDVSGMALFEAGTAHEHYAFKVSAHDTRKGDGR